MSCFPCFSSDKKKGSKKISASVHAGSRNGSVNKKSENAQGNNSSADNGNIAAHTFTFRELASATNNFLPDCLLGEGGFGRVYKGRLENDGKLVAVKQLDRNGLQGNKEFVVEVLMLSQLHHENLVNLIGYCADGDQRLLVYEFMPLGSLEDHLLELSPDQKPLNWNTRIKIASGAAQGLEYLHDKANPPVIYRDLKSSNILLDEGFNPKLSDFGLAKLGPTGDKMHVSSRVMGTYGYCAPEYARTGQLTLKSDVYSFGVVLLELITGRRVIDTTKPTNEQNLVSWAQPMFKDQKRYPELVDPLIQDGYPSKSLNQAVAVAAMCLQEEASVRPLMADVVMALSFLVDAPSDVKVPPRPPSVKTPPIPEEPPQSDEDKTSSDEESSSSDAIQLGSNSRASRASRHESRRRSSSRYSQGSRQGSLSSSSRSHRESRHGSEGSSSKHNRGSRRGSVSSSSKHIQGSLDGSSSKRSRGSRRGSGHSSSKHIQGSPHGSDRSSSKHTEGSLHGSGRSASDWGSQYGSGRSSSRHSQGSEHESET